jgi:cell division transport system ATP-binding protein
MSLIELKDVTKVYKNGVTALADVSLEIKKGEFVFITGGSGSGKSTLIKLLYREEKPTRGNVIVGGVNVSKLRNRKVYKLRRKIGIVFQDFKLLEKLTVYENIAFVLEMYGMKKSIMRPKILKALEQVGLKDKARSYPDELSGGEQQRVSIARAIVNEPKVLICDEPTGNLDPKMSLEIARIIETINTEMETTVILVTHDETIVNILKKRVITLEKGMICKDEEKGRYKHEVPKNNK